MAPESRCSSDAMNVKLSKMSRYCNHRYNNNNNNNNNRHRVSNSGSIGIVAVILLLLFVVCIGSFVSVNNNNGRIKLVNKKFLFLRRIVVGGSYGSSSGSRTRRRLLLLADDNNNTTNTANTTTPMGAEDVTDGANGNGNSIIPVVTWFCFWLDPEDCLSPLSKEEESPPPPITTTTASPSTVIAAVQDDNVTQQQQQQQQSTNSSLSSPPTTSAPSTIASPTTPGHQTAVSPFPTISPDRPPSRAPTTETPTSTTPFPTTWIPTYLPTWNPTVLPTTISSSSSLAPVFINDHNSVDLPRLKLYWEDGYYWQDETFERKWCVAYHFDDENDCWYGQDKRPCNDYHLYLNWCRDWDERQRFDVMQVRDNIVSIRLQTINGDGDDSVIVDWCWSISGVFVIWEHCNNQNRRQQWIADTRSYRFQLRPATRPSSCVTTHHHPKPGEVLELVNCNQARRTDTSFWNLYW